MHWVASCCRGLSVRAFDLYFAEKTLARFWDPRATAIITAVRTGYTRCFSQGSIFSSIDELNQDIEGHFGGNQAHNKSDHNSFKPKGTSGHEIKSQNLEQQASLLNREVMEFFGAENLQLQSNTNAAAPCSPVSTPSHTPPISSLTDQDMGMHSRSAIVIPDGTADSGGMPGNEPHLTHVDDTGRAAMVDVSQKRDSIRSATASARVMLGPTVYQLVSGNQLKKGDVLTVAQLAGVMGAKYTSSLIPLCHNILLSKVHVELKLVPSLHAVDILAEAKTVGPTGVEMEALTAACVGALTVYDMVKAASKDVTITDIKLIGKTGGKSGEYLRVV